MKGQVLTIVLLSSTYANPLLDLNLEDKIKTENKIKNKITSSSFDAKDQPEVTSGWVSHFVLHSPPWVVNFQSLIIQFSSGEESLGRYLALVSSIGSWLGGVEWKKYGDFSHHLTLPGSGLPIYLNGTSATFNAVLGNLAAVGLSKSGWPFFKDDSTLKARPARYKEVCPGKYRSILWQGRDIGSLLWRVNTFWSSWAFNSYATSWKKERQLETIQNSTAQANTICSVLQNYLMLTARTEWVSLGWFRWKVRQGQIVVKIKSQSWSWVDISDIAGL